MGGVCLSKTFLSVGKEKVRPQVTGDMGNRYRSSGIEQFQEQDKVQENKKLYIKETVSCCLTDFLCVQGTFKINTIQGYLTIIISSFPVDTIYKAPVLTL